MATGGSGRDTKYIGALLYEEKSSNEYVAIFTVAKGEDTLDDYVRRKHPGARGGSLISFTFVQQQDSTLPSRGDYIELKFGTPQVKSTTGWIIKPHTVPCRIYRSDVDKACTPGYPDPPSSSISVHATLDAVFRLEYTIPLEGVVVAYDDTLYISRTLRKGHLLDINDLQYVLDTLNEAGFSQGEWKPLGIALGLYYPTLKAIGDEYRRDEQGCLRQCLGKWLERADDVDAEGGPRMTSLCAALEDIGDKAAADYIRKNIIDKDSPELHHYREALKTIVRCRLTKAVVQGEARVGKTCFKSLLLDEKYVKASTGLAEPRVGIYCYRRDTGKRYKLLDVTELEQIVKNALKKDAVEKWTNSPVENQVRKSIYEKKLTRGNETADETDDGFVDDEVTEGPGDGDVAPGDGNKAPGDEKESLLSKEVEKVLDGVRECSGKENRLEGAQWLYLVDTGGQIAFQKLLPIFMPFAQVLILVVNISKELSSGSTAVMHIEGEDHSDGSPSRLTVEEVLKQIISSIASGMQHFRDSYKDHEVLRDLVPKKLQILTIGTHGDECSDVAESKRILAKKLAEIIKGNDDCESIEDHRVVRVREIDGRIASVAVEERGEEENFMNTKSSLDDVDEILTKDDKGINIPFYYYFFDIVLRVAAKEGCGILRLSTCKSLGEDLKLSKDEVMESLNFLHHINSIIYYHDSKACSDLVFVNIGSLIGILKELVRHVHVVHSNKGYAGDDDIIKGILSESKFKEICKEQLDPITEKLKVVDIAMKLLNLFLELSIATQIDDKYFIPALLLVKDVTDINPYKNREPLLFYFKKATPMGLFCSVVTHLLSSCCYEIVSIESNFSNFIELKYRTEGVASFYITLVEQINCIEVHCEKQRGEGIVREDVKMAIVSAAEKHNLSASHEIWFYCSCQRGTTGGGGGVAKGKKHTVEVETVNKEHIFRCSENPHICSDDPPTEWEHKIELWSSWLNANTPNTLPSNDESASVTKQSTPQRSVSETGSTGSSQETKDPKEILQQYSAKLPKAISANVGDVAKALFAKDLITQGTREYVTTVGVANADKADRVMTDVMGQLEAFNDKRQYLVKVCHVLTQQGAAVKQIGNFILKELGEDTATVQPPLPQSGASVASEGECGIETGQEDTPAIETGGRSPVTPLPVQEDSYIAEEEEEEKPSKKENEDEEGGVRQRPNVAPPKPQEQREKAPSHKGKKGSSCNWTVLGGGVVCIVVVIVVFGFLVNSVSEYEVNEDISLDVTNLQEILDVLKDGFFPDHRWLDLGLSLNLIHNDLSVIESDRPTAHRRLQEMLSLWLRRGRATWNRLAAALENIEEYKAAEVVKARVTNDRYVL
ncbi:PREDICTED: uncharacterized protein LOC109588756 isoform X2 [Amphimedon queenslandica]|uniref:Death domain-containing protein n=1 Tax=Amphimedon queenslandica TaxID=400682 RepID=A0AAN0JTJ7_AMPQE|nr:PREDICTED: uncharacterized protein LOC109588756 isoform X2 [Amphimedon queenslandica]|eukprot:XP_019860432.1 PREDICTED: uncharacterized protein LOC109588756 isoform X2 [Amphimedon queenslandica]